MGDNTHAFGAVSVMDAVAPQSSHPRGADQRRVSITQALAAVLMSAPAALSTGAAIAVASPTDPIHGIFLGGLTLPLVWVGLIVWAYLARSAARAWLGLVLLTAVACGVVAGHEFMTS